MSVFTTKNLWYLVILFFITVIFITLYAQYMLFTGSLDITTVQDDEKNNTSIEAVPKTAEERLELMQSLSREGVDTTKNDRREVLSKSQENDGIEITETLTANERTDFLQKLTDTPEEIIE